MGMFFIGMLVGIFVSVSILMTYYVLAYEDKYGRFY